MTHGCSKQPSVSTSAFYAIPAYAHPFSCFSNKAMKYPQENIKPYNEEESKAAQVEKMFDNIAPAYDKLNHALSWNIDKSWRRKAINLLKPFQPQRVMDVATGTGDFAIQAYHILHPQELIGTDISEGMMNIGRAKVKQAGLDKHISFAKEDCTSLSFPDHRFDAITVAFGIRNFEHLDQGLQEMYRVLVPGGHLVILELSEPEGFPMKQLYAIYSKVVIPTIGKFAQKTAVHILTCLNRSKHFLKGK